MIFCRFKRFVAGLNIALLFITFVPAETRSVKDENVQNQLDITESEKAVKQYVYGASSRGENIKRVYKKVGRKQSQWNLQMVNVNKDKKLNTKKKRRKIKVAIIDSGVDYSDDIDIACRKNFIPDEDNVPILFEDGSGHGTSVAGIIAAKDNNEGITGIDEDVELYSAKVLDENNCAPISRVIEAINWAIDENVDIINMSFGTSTYSETLQNTIRRAKAEGILLIASAGNGGRVEYPAAYDEVLAVGAVGPDGKISEESSTGIEIDVTAPGEQICSTGAFGGIMISGGTSMAAPHVTGIAAVLWQKNRNAPADFIEKLICSSAKEAGDRNQYGAGIVDLEYAMNKYDEAWKFYKQNCKRNIAVILERNEEPLQCFHDVNTVEGRWTIATHQDLAGVGNLSGTTLKIVKKGARINDDYVKGMTEHPQFHGYIGSGANVNYLSSYILLTKMAKSYYGGNYSDPGKVSGLNTSDYNHMCNIVGGGINGISWNNILSGYTVNAKNKSLILYGMALHQAADTFAHSSYVNGRRIKHEDNDNNGIKDADDKNYSKNRYSCACKVAAAVLTHINGGTGNINDFVKAADVYNDTFDLYNLRGFAKAADSAKYNQNKAAFDKMST